MLQLELQINLVGTLFFLSLQPSAGMDHSVPAALYCWSQLYGSFQQLGLNPYDVRRTCDRVKDGQLCYKEMKWIDTYLNKPEVKKELGAVSSKKFESSQGLLLLMCRFDSTLCVGCNLDVNQAFMAQGDAMHNAAALLPELLESGIRLLVYAGNAGGFFSRSPSGIFLTDPPSDFMCNFIVFETYLASPGVHSSIWSF